MTVSRSSLLLLALACITLPSMGCSRAALKRLAQTAANRTLRDSSDETLREIFERANKACPQRVDKYTTLVEVKLVGMERVEYRYVVNDEGKKWARHGNTHEMQKKMIEHMKGNPVAVAITERDLSMEHTYNDKSGNYLLSFTINRAVLEGGVGAAGKPQSNSFNETAGSSKVLSDPGAESDKGGTVGAEEPVLVGEPGLQGEPAGEGESASEKELMPRVLGKPAPGVPAIQANPYFYSTP